MSKKIIFSKKNLIFYLKKVLKQEFFRNFIKVFSGNAIAQILPLAFTPIFARVFTAEDYGKFAIFMTVSMFIGSISALRYELSIVPVKEDSEAKILYNLSIRLVTVLSFASVLICLVFFMLDITNFGHIILLIPLAIFTVGFYNTARMWCVRNSRFSVLSISVVVGVIVAILTKFFWGFFIYNGNGLIYSFLISKAITLLVLFWKNNQVLNFENLSDLKKIAFKHRKLPYFNLPQVLMDAIQNHGFIFFISSFYTQEAVGQYYMAAKFVRLPATYLGAAFTPVFFQRISQKVNNNEKTYSFTLKFIGMLFFISVPVFLTFILFGSNIFSFILGEKWHLAGTIASYISIWMLFKFISSPISQIPIIFDRNKEFLKITVIYNFVILVAFAISAFLHWNLQQTLLAVATSGSVVLALATIWILNITKNEV